MAWSTACPRIVHYGPSACASGRNDEAQNGLSFLHTLAHLPQAPVVVKSHGQADGVEAKHLHPEDHICDVLAHTRRAFPEVCWCCEPATAVSACVML